MGIILSRFREKKTTIEILEDLDEQIKESQQYGQTMEQRHKKIVRTIIIYGIVFYVMIIIYFCFFPASLYNQFIYIIRLLFSPYLLIRLTKKMVSWYYNRKITHNREKLSTIVSEKKKILNKVTETETYNKAKEILLRFAPEELYTTPLTQKQLSMPTETPRRPTPQAVISPQPDINQPGELRRRAISAFNAEMGVTDPGLVTPNIRPINQPLNTPLPSSGRIINPASIGFRSPLPRPVLPQQRTVDCSADDGPSNRYTLISRQCKSHNGMALKEEFEYFDYEAVVKLSDGVNADLRNVCTEAELFAIRLKREYVIQEDSMKAVRKVSNNKKLKFKLDYKPV